MKENLSQDNSLNFNSEDDMDVDDTDTIDEEATKESKSKVNLELILDVQVDLEIELGKKRMSLEEVLELQQGSVLPLDKTVNDPVDLYINGTLIANGMLITIDEDDTLGFQITNIVDRIKRIRSLK